MNAISSQARKWAYLAGIIVLLIPVILLGRPSAPPSKAQPSGDSGGTLAQIRAENDLGESSLGQVDPSSATMNLVLLGLRGVAANVLSVQLDHYKDTKDWPQLRSTTESIILLQPHFQKVWVYHGWNLAYNVSAEWDAVSDRYYWVKEGAKFYKKGTERNYKYPELYWYVGDTIGKKIGKSDEKLQFRKFFRKDPDPTLSRSGEPGPDPELNPNDEDNYLEAKKWFQSANDVIDRYGKEEHIMALILFRCSPARATFDFAASQQSEGVFGEVTRQAWEDGFEFWTQKYGKEEYDSPGGLVHMEWKQGDDYPKGFETTDQQLEFRKWVVRYQDMCNYRYWRARSLAERDQNSVETHQDIYAGTRKLLEGDSIQAQELTFRGLEKYEKMLADHPDLEGDEETIEDVMLAQLTWRNCLTINGENIPSKYPLQAYWEKHQNRLPAYERVHARKFRPDR